ncbi:MAG TPA: hypothetical protein VGK73_40300 [Polyangiaceae bacterium]
MAAHAYDIGEMRLDAAPIRLRSHRVRGKLVLVWLLGAALLALLGVSYALYARAPDAAPVRVGTSR